MNELIGAPVTINEANVAEVLLLNEKYALNNSISPPPQKLSPTHAPQGTRVTCSMCALPICEIVVADARAGAIGWHNFFGNWRVEQPRIGMRLSDIECPACGGAWIKTSSFPRAGGVQTHMAGYGWWPGISTERPVKPTHPFVVKRGLWARLVEYFKRTIL